MRRSCCFSWSSFLGLTWLQRSAIDCYVKLEKSNREPPLFPSSFTDTAQLGSRTELIYSVKSKPWDTHTHTHTEKERERELRRKWGRGLLCLNVCYNESLSVGMCVCLSVYQSCMYVPGCVGLTDYISVCLSDTVNTCVCLSTSNSVCLCLTQFVCLFVVCLSSYVYPSVCLIDMSLCLVTWPVTCLCMCLSVRLSYRQAVRHSVCVSVPGQSQGLNPGLLTQCLAHWAM